MASNKNRTKSLWQRAVTRANNQVAVQSPIGSAGFGVNVDGVGGGVMFKDKSSSSFHKIAANLWETKKVVEKEKEIKAKTEELDDLREKYTKEQNDRQRLQKQLDNLSSSQSDSSRKLMRVQETADKLRIDNKKKQDEIEKLERNISHMEDRIRNLEIRASEVEKAELTLESTRRNLEASQQEVKVRERELARAEEKYEEVCKQLESSNNKIQELEKKIEDLKIQVRYELMKNENIEKGLETIPRLKDEIEERDKKIEVLQKELEERSALLNASRKSAREYRDRIRDLERKEEETLNMRDELEVAQSEVNTLKKLMSGKDALVLQKCNVLDQAKASVDALRISSTTDDEKTRLRRVQNVLDQLKHLHLVSVGDNKDSTKEKEKPAPHNRFAQSRPRSAMGDRNIDVNQHPYALENGHNKENDDNLTSDTETGNQKSSTYIFLERFLNDTEGVTPTSKQKRARTAGPSASSGGRGATVQRSASFQHNEHANTDSSALRSQKKTISSHNVSDRRPVTSSASPRNRKSGTTTTMYMNASGQRGSAGNLYTSENSHKLSSKYQPSLDYALGVSTDEELTTDTSYCLSSRQRSSSPTGYQQHANTRSAHSRPKSSYYVSKRGYNQSGNGSDTESNSQENGVGFADIVGARLSNQQLATLSKLSASQKDAILCDAIQNGDRVTITVHQKPPRYGRKKPKPIIYTGIVKYKGHLDKDHYDARIYVGIRLDAPLGETDGTYKGKRYMFTPPDHAKFFKIRDLDTVLDVPSGMYIPTSKLILRHIEVHQSQNAHNKHGNGYTVTTSSYNNSNNNINNNNSSSNNHHEDNDFSDYHNNGVAVLTES